AAPVTTAPTSAAGVAAPEAEPPTTAAPEAATETAIGTATGTGTGTETATGTGTATSTEATATPATGTTPAAETEAVAAVAVASEAVATTAASAGGSGSGPRGLLASVPGRPGKPMLAAAAVTGLLLIAVPFLISGSDDGPAKAATVRADGSPIGPDGTLPGLVPGTQSSPGQDPGAGPGTQAGAPSTDAGAGTLPFGAPPNGAPEGNAPAGHGNVGQQSPQDAPGQPGGNAGTSNPAGAGTGTGTGPGTKPVAPVAPANPAPVASVPVFSKLVGPGCGSGGFSVSEQFKDGVKGWRYGTSGWKSDGCDGDFLAMPMSGSSTKADSGIYAKWEFSTGAVKSGSCTVYTYIPSSGDKTMVGGNPARYTVRGANGRLGDFSIDQASNTGRWVKGGSFAISSPEITVSVDNRGIDWGSGNENRHVAAAQMKVDCKGN
ncbi:hypothetical protein ACFCZ1_37400, partial [Streptomyces sp. NPDC056224]|uniref:hypothetical protein n=1 Tax=Streptomyces sp. NPDC056224 TaxID=3345750 RepID=UPI0035D8E0B0